jgi:hypothetical protein
MRARRVLGVWIVGLAAVAVCLLLIFWLSRSLHVASAAVDLAAFGSVADVSRVFGRPVSTEEASALRRTAPDSLTRDPRLSHARLQGIRLGGAGPVLSVAVSVADPTLLPAGPLEGGVVYPHSTRGFTVVLAPGGPEGWTVVSLSGGSAD